MPKDRKEKSRRYYLKHKDEILARNKRYTEAHSAERHAYAKTYRTEEENKRRRKNSQLLRDFGITLMDYEIQMARQSGVCASCGDPPPPDKYLSVDHKHSTGEPRALLCNGCNLGIGFFKEDPDRLLKAVEYLRKHKNGSNFALLGPRRAARNLPWN